MYQSVVNLLSCSRQRQCLSTIPSLSQSCTVSSIDQEGTRQSPRETNTRRTISTVQVALNYVALFALVHRSRIWLIHYHPMFPVSTAQVTYLSTHLVSKVCRLDNITKQANFDNPGQQLDFHEKLIVYQ
jgi:hypothetical protein